MKKIVKKVAVAMALVTCATMTATAVPQLSVFAATPSTPDCVVKLDSFNISEFKRTGNVGEEYTFAAYSFNNSLASSAGFAKLTIKDPYGQEVEGFTKEAPKVVNAGDATVKFTPSVSGNYIATYEIVDTSSATVTIETVDFVITITNQTEKLALAFPENSEKIVPSRVATETNGQATKIVFPEPILQDKDGNVLDAQAEGVTIVKEVTATDASVVIGSNWVEATSTLTIDKTNITDEATYKVRYKAYKVNPQDENDRKLVATATVSVVAEKGYKAPEYKYAYNETKPTTAEIGVETILPGVDATSTKDSSKVSVHYAVEVRHNNVAYEVDGADGVLKINEKGQYVFTPDKEGKYEVKYTIKDFTGKAPSVDSTAFTISDVADRTAPSPMVTLPYAEGTFPELDAVEAFADVQTNTAVMLLPIAATDAANGFVDDNLTLYRQIVKKGNEGVIVFDESNLADQNPNKALVFNASSLSAKDVYVDGKKVTIETTDMVNVTEFNGDSEFKIDNGEYTVKYIAKDKLSGKGEVVLTLDLTVEGGYNPASVSKLPQVSFASATPIPSSAQAGDVIKFNIPTATQETDNLFKDTHLSTFVEYSLYDGSSWSTAVRYDAADSWLAKSEDKKSYTLSLPDELGAYEAIKIIASSYNDAGKLGTSEKEIKFIGAGDDTATTVVSSDVANSKAGKVGAQTTLPTVIYSDDMPRFVKVNVSITGEDGSEYVAQNMKYSYTSSTSVTVSDAFFVPETEGNYKVVYTSFDAANNMTTVAFVLTVGPNADSFTANFENVPASINGGKAELGERISLPDLNVYVSSEHLTAQPWYLNVEGPAGVDTDGETYIKFDKTGDYTIQFVSDVEFNADVDGHTTGELFKQITTKKYTITVSDSTGPVVENLLELEEKFFALNQNGSLAKDTTIKLADIALPEATDVVWANSTLAVVGNGVTYDTFKLDADGITRLTETGVTLSKDGVYNFIFTLKDANNNSTLLDTFSVDVGDVYAPELEVKEGVVAATYKAGDTVKVDMSKITATDKLDGANYDGNNIIIKDGDKGYKLVPETGALTITVKNTTTGETFTSEGYDRNNLKFEFKDLKAGEYTLNVTIKDSSTKETTNSEIKFTVSDTATSAVTGEEVLGVVLIVVSVLMLGGVVTYFVLTRKKYQNYK